MFRLLSRSLPFVSTFAAVAMGTGCMLVPFSADPAAGGASLMVSPQVQAGGYANQALVSPYTADQVTHVMLALHTVEGSSESLVAEKDLPKADLGQSIVFGRLRPELTYRVRARAYKEVGTSPSDLISVDASSSVEVVIGRETQHAIALTVQLADRSLGGTTVIIPGVTVTEGRFTASGSVTVTPNPAP